MADDTSIRSDSDPVKGIPKKQANDDANDPSHKPESPNAPIAVAPAKTDFSPANRHNCCKKYQSVKEEIKFWFEIAGIIAGIGVLILLWKQYGEMVKTTNLAIGQLTTIQEQSKVMRDQLDESKAATRLNERAWVAENLIIVNTNLQNAPNALLWRVQYKNTGQTPAVKVQIDAGSGTNFPTIDIPPAASNPYGSMIEPGGENHTPDMLVLGSDIQRVKIGVPFYLYGTIWYEDIFGNRHWSKFCFELSKDIEAKPISAHSSCDDVPAD